MSINQRRRASIAKNNGVGTVCTVTNNVRAPGKPKKVDVHDGAYDSSKRMLISRRRAGK